MNFLDGKHFEKSISIYLLFLEVQLAAASGQCIFVHFKNLLPEDLDANQHESKC